MFARLVEAPAKPGKRDEIVTILQNEVVPLLRKQKGFVDFVALGGEANSELGITLTFWTTKDEAEKFWNSQEFKPILGRIKDLSEGLTVRTFDVKTSTIHKIAAGKAA